MGNTRKFQFYLLHCRVKIQVKLNPSQFIGKPSDSQYNHFAKLKSIRKRYIEWKKKHGLLGENKY